MSTLSNAALEEAIALLSTQQDMVEHQLLTHIRAFDQRKRFRDHGLPSTAAWLGFRVGLGLTAAREKVRIANALEGLPLIDAAFAKGELSYSKVRAMTRIATPENEAKLLYTATQATAAQLDIICRGVVRMTREPGELPKRCFRIESETDGMIRMTIRVHADEAAVIKKALELARGDASAEASPDRADGLVRIAEAFISAAPSSANAADHQQIVVSVQTSELSSDGIVTATDGLATATETLKRLACDASMTTVKVDHDGDPLDVGRRRRTIPIAIRRALRVRDRGCRFPGCTNHRWVHAHHIDHWADGGATSKDNLVLLCSAHHRLVHEGRYTVARTSKCTLEFRRPDGTILATTDDRPTPKPPNLPNTRPRRAIHVSRPNYSWAVGGLLPRRVH